MSAISRARPSLGSLVVLTSNPPAKRVRRLGFLARVVFAIMSLGCASYRGTSRSIDPVAAVHTGNWWLVPSFPRVAQDTSNDCGAAALAAVMQFWGNPSTPQSIEAALGSDDHRLRAGDISAYARKSESMQTKIIAILTLLIMFVASAARAVTDSVLNNPEQPSQIAVRASPPRGVSLGTHSEDQRYAAHESASPDAKKYRGGDVIVISATALIIVLLAVIILILI